MALDNTKIKSKPTLDAVLAINKLRENNQTVLIRCIPAHSGYVGNENEANNIDATLLKLTISKVTWRNKVSRSIHNLNRGNLWKATMFLTGHVALNYHLNKYKPNKTSKTYPHCTAAGDTTNHYIGQCPQWSAQRSAVLPVFDSFYLSGSEVVHDFTFFAILKYINSYIIYLPKFNFLRFSKFNLTANSDVNF